MTLIILDLYAILQRQIAKFILASFLVYLLVLLSITYLTEIDYDRVFNIFEGVDTGIQFIFINLFIWFFIVFWSLISIAFVIDIKNKFKKFIKDYEENKLNQKELVDPTKLVDDKVATVATEVKNKVTLFMISEKAKWLFCIYVPYLLSVVGGIKYSHQYVRNNTLADDIRFTVISFVLYSCIALLLHREIAETPQYFKLFIQGLSKNEKLEEREVLIEEIDEESNDYQDSYEYVAIPEEIMTVVTGLRRGYFNLSKAGIEIKRDGYTGDDSRYKNWLDNIINNLRSIKNKYSSDVVISIMKYLEDEYELYSIDSIEYGKVRNYKE
jgi:hypothetical protein